MNIILIFSDTDLMENQIYMYLGKCHVMFFGLDSLGLKPAFSKDRTYLIR